MCRLPMLVALALGSIEFQLPTSPHYYTILIGVLPKPYTPFKQITGANYSLVNCKAACDSIDTCQGFSVDSWLSGPPTACTFHSDVDALVLAACDSGTLQKAAFFAKEIEETSSTSINKTTLVTGSFLSPATISTASTPTTTRIPGPAPYQQFAGLMAEQRTVVAATITSNGNVSVCVEACDADVLCVGFALVGCSPEQPGQFCWTQHAEAVQSLIPNIIDHACFYQKPGVPNIPIASPPAAAWSCATECDGPAIAAGAFGCKFELSQWSDGSPEFNCKMRNLAWEYGKQLRPDYGQFEDLYFALGLNKDDCDATATAAAAGSTAPLLFASIDRAPVPKTFSPIDAVVDGAAYFVDFNNGVDTNAGTLAAPFKTIQSAVNAAALKPDTTINLREGTHYLTAAVQISAANAGLTIQNYNGERAIVSGAIKLANLNWTHYTLPAGRANGVDWHANAYSTDVSAAGLTEFPGFQVNGVRATRARFPNGNPEFVERSIPQAGDPNGPMLMPGVQSDWVPPDHTLLSKIIQVKNGNRSQMRNGSVDVDGKTPLYTTYMGGYGGPCEIYEPPFSYWCSDACSGGGAHIAEHVRGVTPPAAAISPAGGSANAGLHMPYKTMEGAIVNAYHEGRWANWMWEVDNYTTQNNRIMFGRGGFQESRGSLADRGGDWFVENVFEEFDSPNEFFWDKQSQTLYYFHNDTGPPPTSSTYEVPQLRSLFNLSSTSRWQPIVNVTLRGLTLTSTRFTYMDPHGVPSAGDFAMTRSAAVQLEGTEGVKVTDCNFTRLDGNGLIISGYNRNATVLENTFSWIGDNGVVVWGRTNETAANPLEGFDGTDGNHPQHTKVVGNVVREIGIYEKQTSWYFQAKAAESVVLNNVFFNAPRNGITFNDPFAGGDLISGNLAFSAMQETSDGGTYNSWDRQPFLTDTASPMTGVSPSPFMDFREISRNFFINNYHMEMSVDTDDGSSYVNTHHNFLVGGEWALKSDAGGHSNYQHHNLNAYATGPAVFLQAVQTANLADRFFNNTVIQRTGPVVEGSGVDACAILNLTNTSIYSESGFMRSCSGGSVSKHGDGNTVAGLPEDDDVMRWARELLGMDRA